MIGGIQQHLPKMKLKRFWREKMSKKLQCQECGRAEYGEDLYNYDGELLCRYCIVARVYEGSIPCEYVGTCNDKTYLNKTEQIDQLKQQLEEKDKEIEKLHRDKEWYSMWHKEFQKRIEDLTTELETYRPTKLHGNGQCECYKCKQEGRQPIHWTDWCNEYKGHIYCNKCLKDILKEEQTPQTQLAIQELEKVKASADKWFDFWENSKYEGNRYDKLDVSNAYLQMSCEIDQQIKELKGEKDAEG